MIIWFTGLSGVGKTTLSKSLYDKLKNKGIKNIIWLDGDILRDAISPDLDFSEKSRIKQITKTQRLAKHLESQDHIVIVSALYSNSKLLSWNRDNFKEYIEIYLHASIGSLKERDTKNLYINSISGKIKNVVGIDINWEEPKHPDIMINNTKFPNLQDTTRMIVDVIYKKSPLNLE